VKVRDPLALAFFGASLALLAGLLLYVLVFKTPESATPARAFDIVGEARRQIERIAREAQDKAPVAKPQAPPSAAKPLPPQPPVARSSPPAAAVVAGSSIESGRSWRYAVVVEPPTWRDITLTYRTQREGTGTGVLTDFIYAGGKMNFHLGTYAAGHPSHANTRFPGFFMYASYFPPSLEKGQRLQWQWPWQPAREGRLKRYDGQVIRWENLQVPAGTYRAAVIEANLDYVEGGSVQARVKETIWYAPAVSQVVKVIREGKSPDEASSRIVAELIEYR
jgi:hypothetical protein